MLMVVPRVYDFDIKYLSFPFLTLTLHVYVLVLCTVSVMESTCVVEGGSSPSSNFLFLIIV